MKALCKQSLASAVISNHIPIHKNKLNSYAFPECLPTAKGNVMVEHTQRKNKT